MGNRTFNWAELKPEVKQVWKLSLPAILTQITTIAMQYIDSAMVGALGAGCTMAYCLQFLPDFRYRWHITLEQIKIWKHEMSSGTA